MAAISTVRARARAAAKSHRTDPRALARTAIDALKKDEQFAFELFRALPSAVLTLTPSEIAAMLAHTHDWNSTDCFASFVSGVAWRHGVLTDRHILGWTRSDIVWTRRAALVSTVPLNTKARGASAPTGEAKKTLAVCERLIDDREDMVVKALSWALRELAARDRAPVETFLELHGERLAGRVRREVTNVLNTGLKNPRRTAAAPRRRSTSKGNT